MTIPADVIDPDAVSRRWHAEFTAHLDQVPPLMDAMSILSQTTIASARFDQVRITGGGFFDRIPITDGSVGADAEHLWQLLVEYTRAVVAFLEPILEDVDRPSIITQENTWKARAPKPDADPLIARGQALVTVGWLIDHAALIEPIHELDEFRSEMFSTIRRLNGKHRGGRVSKPHPRHCDTCGERRVRIVWVDGANGSPKPVQVARCGNCGHVFVPSVAGGVELPDPVGRHV